MCDDYNKFKRYATSVKSVQIKELFAILTNGALELCKETTRKNEAILVFKNTRSDEIFVQWMAETDSKFYSHPDTINLGEYHLNWDPATHKKQQHDDTEHVVQNYVAHDSKHDGECIPSTRSGAPDDGIFYDFPAFTTGRGVPCDVAATHLTKQITHNPSRFKIVNIKICFLVEYYMITSSGERSDLRDFFKHIIDVLQNVDEFKNSIFLVVSKIPSRLSKTSDESIIGALVSGMQTLRHELEIQTEPHKTENSKIIKLIDLLTSTEKKAHPRLAIFRSPNQPGPLQNIALMKRNKENVKRKLQDLSYVNLTRGVHFGYTLPPTSLHAVSTFVEEIRNSIVVDVRTSASRIQQYFAAKEATIKGPNFETSLRHVYEQMKSGHEKILAIKTSAVKSANLTQCINRIVDGVANVTDNAVKLNMSSTLNSIDAGELLQTVVGGPRSEITWCVDGLADVTQYLDDSRKWYHFANRLYDRLLNCNISRSMGTYNLTDEDVDEKVSETDLKVFLLRNTQEEQLFVQYDAVKDVALNEFKLETAKQIANLATQYRRKNQQCLTNNSSKRKGPSFGDIYNVKAYVNDFFKLEESFLKVSNRTYFLSYYHSMYARVVDFVQNRSTSNQRWGFCDPSTLSYLPMCILTRIQNIDNRLESYVPYKSLDFFENSELNQLYVLLYRPYFPFAFRQRENFDTKFNIQILEAYAVLESTSREIESIYTLINSEIGRLIVVVQRLIKQGAKNREELMEQQNMLMWYLPLRILIGMLQNANFALSFAGPASIVAAGAGNKILRHLDGYQNPQTDTEKSMIGGISYFSKSFKHVRQLEIQNLHKNLTHLVERIETDASADHEDLKEITFQLGNAIKLLGDHMLASSAHWEALLGLNKALRRYRQKHVSLYAVAKTPTEKETEERKVKFAEQIQGFLALVETGVAGYEQTGDLMFESGETLQDVMEVIGKLKAVENSIISQILPKVDEIQKNVSIVLVDYNMQSHAAILDNNRRLMQNLLLSFKTNIDFFKSIPTYVSPFAEIIITFIEKLEGEMSTSARIYDRVRDYEDESLLLSYYRNLDGLDNDPDLTDDIAQLQLQLRSNLILKEEYRKLAVFKHFVFPFADAFKDALDVTQFLSPRTIASWETSIHLRKLNLTSYVQSIRNQPPQFLPDQIHPKTNFHQAEKHQPFFIWRHETHKEKISKLLQGREVRFNADITQIRDVGNVEMNAVKFNQIGIRFSSPNKTIENAIIRALMYTQTKMTHMGASYYRCNNEYYVFDHLPIEIREFWHSFINLDGELKYLAPAATSLDRNGPLLSPYAEWKIQLVDSSGHLPEGWKALNALKDQPIDLVLEGAGSYVAFPAKTCDTDLKKYYKLVGSFPEQPLHEQPSFDHYRYDPNASFATNDATGVKSPINIAIGSLTGILGYLLKPFWIPNEMRFNLVKHYCQSIFGYSKLFYALPATEDYVGAATTSVNFSVFESLTLADFLIRWLTKVKHFHNEVTESINSVEITVFALNLVEQMENLIRFDFPDEYTQFDALALVSKLEKKLAIDRNNTAVNVKNLLYQAVADAIPNLDRSPAGDGFRQKIAKMVLDHEASNVISI